MDIALKIQYDGTDYSGWQYQPNSITIQELINKSLCKVLGDGLTSVGSGRTDAGVHARGQVCSIPHNGTPKLEEKQLIKALNNNLPFDIRIVDAKYFDKFHARFDAIFREYSFTINTNEDVFNRRFSSYIKYPINKDLLFNAAYIFKVMTDFTTFSKINPDTINPVCNIVLSQWEQISPSCFMYRIKSNHFLYGMVRSIVGTMVDIARGKRAMEEVNQALYLKDRRLNSPLISPTGLVLEKIYYSDEFDI